MRSVFRSVLVALVAVLALGAVVSASAFASPGWEVKEGGAWKALGTGESRNVMVEGGTQVMAWSYSQGTSIVFTCGTVRSTGKIVGGNPGTGEVSSISYSECGVSNISGCELKSPGNRAGKITTANAETTLVTFEGGGTGEKFSHGGSGTWFEVEIGKEENETTHKFKKACGALPTMKLVGVGTVVSKLETGAGGNLGESFAFTSPGQEGNDLTLASKPLTIAGSEVQAPASGEGEALRVAP